MLMGSVKFQIMVLVVLVVLGSISGACAVALHKDNSHGKAIYVSNNGTDRSEGLTPQAPKRNIKSAMISANPGDTISVAPGIYKENLVIDKSLTITGTNPENTIIDGNHIANCIYVQGGVTVKIKGFTIRNGVQKEHKLPYRFGGGICNANGTVTLENSIITDNTADYGGGIYNEIGAMNLRNVTIKNNKANISGGGLGNEKGSTMTIEDSLVINNTAKYYDGGGIYNIGKMTVKRSTIKNNHARNGGGICEYGRSTVEDSIITGNTADIKGGGLYSPRYVYNTTITNNRAADGGGIYVDYECYVDDLSVSLMSGNSPNNFGGIPYIPA